LPKHQKLLLATKKIATLSKLEQKLFPIEKSKIVFDLLTITTHFYLANKPLSIKQIFLSLDYSENGIRKQLRRLIAQKWLKVDRSINDKRIYYIIPTAKLLNSFKKYTTALENLFR
jgi:DNA-binding MarR family transcriptional regulator